MPLLQKPFPTFLWFIKPSFYFKPDISCCQKLTHTCSAQLLDSVRCPSHRYCNVLPISILTPSRRSSQSLYLHSPARICLSLPVKIRTWEGDFILHWSMKTFYKYIATAGTLIALAILIWLFCCASQRMEERETEWVKGGWD